jgi:ribonuclease VapC
MIVLDSSAVVAIVRDEPEAHVFSEVLGTASSLSMSAVNVFETRLVLSRSGRAEDVAWFDTLLGSVGIAVVPFDAEMATAAFVAHSRYGRGRHSKAKLNLGDCAAYALAKSLDAPLLFKGVDFRHTDVTAAL